MGQNGVEEMVHLVVCFLFNIARTAILSYEIHSFMKDKKIPLIKWHHTIYSPYWHFPSCCKTLLWSYFVFSLRCRQTSPFALSCFVLLFPPLSHPVLYDTEFFEESSSVILYNIPLSGLSFLMIRFSWNHWQMFFSGYHSWMIYPKTPQSI